MTPARFHKVTYGTSLSSGHRWMENHSSPMQIKLLKDKVPQKWMSASPADLKNLDWLNTKQNKRNMGKLMEEGNLIPTIKKLYFNYRENKNRNTCMSYLPCCIMQIFICFNKCSSIFFSLSLTFSCTVYSLWFTITRFTIYAINYVIVMQIHARFGRAIDISHRSLTWS